VYTVSIPVHTHYKKCIARCLWYERFLGRSKVIHISTLSLKQNPITTRLSALYLPCGKKRYCGNPVDEATQGY
jgi:hypothetical protein